MMKSGWNGQSGLGPRGEGRLHPIRIRLKLDRHGIGYRHTVQGCPSMFKNVLKPVKFVPAQPEENHSCSPPLPNDGNLVDSAEIYADLLSDESVSSDTDITVVRVITNPREIQLNKETRKSGNRDYDETVVLTFLKRCQQLDVGGMCDIISTYRSDIVNASDGFGWTPLMCVISAADLESDSCGNLELVNAAIRSLLKTGKIDLSLRNKQNQTALDLAKFLRRNKIVEILEEIEKNNCDFELDRFVCNKPPASLLSHDFDKGSLNLFPEDASTKHRKLDLSSKSLGGDSSSLPSSSVTFSASNEIQANSKPSVHQENLDFLPISISTDVSLVDSSNELPPNSVSPISSLSTPPQSCNEYCVVCGVAVDSLQRHKASVAHRFEATRDLGVASHGRFTSAWFSIPPDNKGYKLMMKSGWNGQSGLGPSGEGRLHPVQTRLKLDRHGIGCGHTGVKKKSRVTHSSSEIRDEERQIGVHRRRKGMDEQMNVRRLRRLLQD